MRRTFVATVVPAGNATGIEVPAEALDALQAGKRPKVTITLNGVTAVEQAKSAATRQRRIGRLIATLHDS